MKDYFSERPILVLLIGHLALAGVAVWGFSEVIDAIATGRITGKHGRVIELASNPFAFRSKVALVGASATVCFGLFLALVRITYKMHRGGDLRWKARPSLVPRHRVAPLSDPTKRSKR